MTGGAGALTTHVLDAAAGRPAAGVRVELWRLEPGPALLAEGVTDADGRLAGPLLPDDFPPGVHELRFHLGPYFGAAGGAPPFLDVVPVRVGLSPGRRYHVPLLCTPWSYSIYRGS